jgi:hypothetical protein
MEIWDEVVKEYNNELLRLRSLVSDGNADSFSHYREIVGHIQGVQWSREVFTTILKKRMYDDEE